jgi:hypothetical protein
VQRRARAWTRLGKELVVFLPLLGLFRPLSLWHGGRLARRGRRAEAEEKDVSGSYRGERSRVGAQ